MARKRIQKKLPAATSVPRSAQSTTSGDWHEVFAIALAGVAILAVLALISYTPEDFPPWRGGAKAEVSNLVGPLGVVAAAGGLHLFGVGAYLLPLLVLVWAVRMLLGKGRLRGISVLAAGVLLVSVCCMAGYQTFCFEGWVERYQLPGSIGGLTGRIVGREWLEGTLGQPGASVLVFLLYVISLMVGTGYRPFRRWSKPGDRPPLVASRPAEVVERLALPEEGMAGAARPARPRRVEMEKPEVRAEIVPAENGSKPKPVPEVAASPARAVEKRVPRPVIVDATVPCAVPARQPAAMLREGAGVGEGGAARYQFPPLGLLDAPEPVAAGRTELDELRARQTIIIETLRNFRVRVEPGDITRGPSVTRYEFYPERGLSVRRIAALEADIALATRAKRITILAPIPGKDTVGIELANDSRVPVGLRDLLQAGAFADAKARIPLALGKDVYGKALVTDLAAMPHLLIAGATGSGKSVCLNTIIASLLYRFRPNELRLIMIDPKVVEMQVYARLPHLAVPVVTEPKRVLAALKWCIQEMERRYRLFADAGVRKLDEYNARITPDAPSSPATEQGELFDEEDYFLPASASPVPAPGKGDAGAKERLPYLVVIIDELADLMQAAPADVETAICRLCQKARAAGIHVIVATQSPRAEVVTGMIKANIPARIAFQVASGTDSRVILDKTGAERLVGKGDLLFQPPDSAVMVRAQGAFLSDEEVERLVDHCSRQARPQFDSRIRLALEVNEHLDGVNELSEDDEDAFQKALELIREEKRASTSFLQRRMRLGYTRAARLMDLLEERGVVGPAEGAKPREILVADAAGES